MVAAEIDGEDSSGRQKLRRMTPDELVEHAIAVAGKAFDKFDEIGWLAPVPSYQELVDQLKDQQNSND